MNKYDICGFDKEEELNYFYNANEPNIENKVSLYELTNNKKMKYLEDFITNYEWVILKDTKKVDRYTIFDLQTDEIVEENFTIEQVIKRVVCRALDYEIDEHYDIFFEDFDCYNHIGYINYINGLLEIGKTYIKNLSDYEKEWLLNIEISIKEMTRYFNEVNK